MVAAVVADRKTSWTRARSTKQEIPSFVARKDAVDQEVAAAVAHTYFEGQEDECQALADTY